LKPVFVDTGAFYALANRKNPVHSSAREFYRSSAAPFITTDFIFAETMPLMTKRLGKTSAVTFGKALLESTRCRIEEVSAEVRGAAWELSAEQPDKEYDWIDCISFKFMESFAIESVFGFDRHFVQYGFELLPSAES
jgi:predicted nucleic acid-binding protein